MSLLESTQPFGRVAHTRVHPAFVALHGRLSGDTEGVRELAESGVSLSTLLSLYPLEVSAYLPHLNATLLRWSPLNAMPFGHSFWKKSAIEESLLVAAAYMMLDSKAVDPLKRATLAESQVRDFAAAATRSLKRAHNRDELVIETELFTSQATALSVRLEELLEFMLLLCYWNDEGYGRFYEDARVKLDAQIEHLLKIFGC